MSRSPLFKPTRRSLLAGLGGLGALGLGGGALSRMALASGLATVPDRYFVFCYFSGGWDVLLGLDPKDPDVFRPERNGDTLIEPAYDQLVEAGISDQPLSSAVPGMDFGPYIGDLIDWAPRMTVVRGLSMDTLTHEVGRRRFLTGKAPAGLQARGSSGATVLASCLGIDDPIPNLAAQVESYNADQPTWATALQVNSVRDLLEVLEPSDAALPPAVADRVGALLDELAACETTKASKRMSDALAQRISAQDLVAQGIDDLFDFASADQQALRDLYGFSSNDLGSARAQAAMAATAITSGISRVVSIRVAGGLDTHDQWATDHGPGLREGFDIVSLLAADLASRTHPGTGESWLDRTTIIGFSEFSRTPLLNSRGGRDHALMNSAFLLGGGVPQGRVIGASSDVGMAPQAIDVNTGNLDPSGEILRPEHILRSLLEGVGVTDDVADLRVDPVPALIA